MGEPDRPDVADRAYAPPQGEGLPQSAAPLLVRMDQQKLARNGNATTVAIQRPYLRHLGWLTGESVIVELFDDDTIRIRKPRLEDFGPRVRKPRRLDLPVVVRA